MDPFLTYSANRELREQVWRNYYNRGDNGDEHDNNAIISEILKLRAARAELLGYETHAHWRLEPQMAKTPENAMDLMMKVWPKAVARVREEVADMQQIADAEGAGITIEPWDYRYYAEKVRKAKYDLDFNEVKPYLQTGKTARSHDVGFDRSCTDFSSSKFTMCPCSIPMCASGKSPMPKASTSACGTLTLTLARANAAGPG